MTKIENLKAEIKEFESLIHSKGVPADEKDAAMDEIKSLKKEIEVLQAKESAVNDMRSEKKKKLRRQIGGKKIKTVKKKAKTPKKKKANMISVGTNVKKFNKGRSASNIIRDKQRRAMLPGKRTSADGNIYYEKRSNRADVSKKDRLEGGGSLYNDGGKTKKVSKFAKVMREFKAGTLKSSSGYTVTDKKQALAIAFAESRKEKLQHA